jgi:hypothetical protein
MKQLEQNKEKNRVKRVRSFGLIPNYLVEAVWDKIIPHLLVGEDHWKLFYSLEDIHNNLLEGRQQLWCYVENGKTIGVVITQLDRFPEVVSLRFQYMGGKGFEPKAMMKCIKKMEVWAMQHGATCVDFLGRRAWERLVPEYGYVCVGSVFRKELIDKNNVSRELQ